jgi:RND family efflux transporter MFP subunit
MSFSNKTSDLSSLRIKRDSGAPPGGSRTRIFAYAALGLVAVLLALILFLNGGNAGAAEVDLAQAALTSPSDANAVLTANGYVVAQQKAAVASKGTGRLVYLGVEEGDPVKKGQIIARIEDQDILAGRAGARASLTLARADSLDAWRSLQRQQQLHISGLTSQAELDAAEARYERVVASIAVAEAAVLEADVALENTRIRAPFDGTVLTKNADVGEVVAPFAASASSRGAVVTMADMNSLQVEADVSESNITRVELGQPCEIILDAYPDHRYRGKVHKIVPTADRAKATVLTKVLILDRDERVLPEMSAKVAFLASGADSSLAGAPVRLTVPLSSIVTRGETSLVLTVRDERVREVPVRTGTASGDRVEITEGLTAGETVVLRPTPDLTTGSRVRARAN